MTQIVGKTALITGGASGIGYLMGKSLLAAGAKAVVIWDIQDALMAGVAKEFTAQGHEAITFRVDLSDAEQIRRVASEMQQRGIAIDILVNNAGIVVGKTFADHSHQEIARTMGINAAAPMHITRELLPGMMQRGSGHIVNIASAAGMVANPKMSVYCASKWAMIGWSDSLRIEMEQARSGVRVTTVTPYYIDTGMFAGVRSPIIPIMKPEAAVRRIMDGIRADKIFVRMPRIINLLPLIRGILPTRTFDLVGGKWLGVYRSMSSFRGRSTTAGQ